MQRQIPPCSPKPCTSPYRHTTHNAVQFQFGSHPLYGDILTARCNGQTTAVLPPFTTLDSRHLARFAELDGTQTLDQFLHTLTVIPEYRQHIFGITLNLNGGQYSSDFILKTPGTHDTPKRKNTGKAAQTLEHAAAKMQSAAAYLEHKNPTAAEFLRHTSEAAAELLGSKTETGAAVPNVLAPLSRSTPQNTVPKKQHDRYHYPPFTRRRRSQTAVRPQPRPRSTVHTLHDPHQRTARSHVGTPVQPRLPL